MVGGGRGGWIEARAEDEGWRYEADGGGLEGGAEVAGWLMVEIVEGGRGWRLGEEVLE